MSIQPCGKTPISHNKPFLLFIGCILSLYSIAQPSINSFSPVSGPVGTPVTINGNNFSSIPSNNIVFFGAVKANVTSASSTSLTVTIPAGANYKPLTVTTGGLTAYSNRSFYTSFAGAGSPVLSSSFDTSINTIADLHPSMIAVSDLDGDGKPDLASSNNYSTAGSPASFSVFRNTSSGIAISFAPKSDFPNGVMTAAIASGDLNGDGKPDIVVSSIADGTISIFNNNSVPGTISFNPKISYATQNNPQGIVITDLDLDGKPDIAVVNYTANSISVFRNTGSIGVISFDAAITISTGLAPSSIATSDLDGDGKPDLAITNEFSNTVSLYRNISTTGNILFAPKTDFATPASSSKCVALGDLDNDGKPDMSVTGGQKLSVYRNTSSTGVISFAPRAEYTTNTNSSVTIGDLNGDGKQDIIVTGNLSSMYQNNSSPGSIVLGTAQPLYITYGSYVTQIVDLNGDSKPDLANAVVSTDRVSLNRNKINEPVITYILGNNAATGDTVRINGSNFNGTTAVSFGGLAAASFTVVNSTLINAIVGAGHSGMVSVTNQYGTTASQIFTYAGPPVIQNISPTSAGYGQTVIITGNNFTNARTVYFGASYVSFSVISPTTIHAVLGTGATGNVSVTTDYGTGFIPGFTYLLVPVISSFSPTQAGPGMPVSIAGNNFIGVTDVSFRGVPAASFTVVSSTSISAKPANGASGAVTVTNGNGSGSKDGFTYIPGPNITSFSPVAGMNGTELTVTGTNFDNISSVRVGSAAYYYDDYTRVSSTTLIIRLNADGNTGDIVITTSGGTATKPGFVFWRQPFVSGIEPRIATTGMPVTIYGNNFNGVTSVTLGGQAVASFTVVSNTIITAVVGAGPGGVVAVSNPAGTGGTGINIIYATWPLITSYSPHKGPIGTLVTIKGKGFNPNASENIVHFGAVKTSGINVTDSSLTVNVPPGASYSKVCVTNTATNGTGYNYVPFTVTFPGGNVAFNNNSFGGQLNIPTGPGLTTTVSRDIDGDGKIDIVATYGNATKISVFRNITTGLQLSFAAAVDIPVNAGINSIVVENFNGDGKLDIVGTKKNFNASYGLTMLVNTSTPGSISFNPYTTMATDYQTYNMASGDFDLDGKPDIVISCGNCGFGGSGSNQNIYTLRNNSTGGNISFSYPISTNANTGVSISVFLITNFIVSDIDLDNRPDIVAGTTGYDLIIFKNNSNPGLSFHAMDIPPYNGTYVKSNAAVADFNNDGYPDVITDNTVYTNLGNFNFSLASTYNPVGPVGSVADLTGDGRPDFVKGTVSTGFPLNIKRNSSTGSISFAQPHVIPMAANNCFFTETADFDGDGKPEIVYINIDLPAITILKNKIGLANLCAGGSTALGSTIVTGTNFQWQVNTGSGFNDLSDNTNYTGSTTSTLQLNNIPSSWSGYQYRCVVDGNFSDSYALQFSNSWSGNVSSAWEDPANWSCGTVPDSNTDVVIESGTVVISSDVVIRSLSLNPAVNFRVLAGYNLTILH
ncbi:MAG TPA: FG-GAP-like repeat-containing protein [Ferruginibacter sp.]|nr:FG-GAP-like repeat-containing protein [Ferruginibacter sp.]